MIMMNIVLQNNLIKTVASIWFDTWGLVGTGRSWFKNEGIVGSKRSTNGGT